MQMEEADKKTKTTSDKKTVKQSSSVKKQEKKLKEQELLIDQAKRDSEDYLNQLKRLKAEFDNFKKRVVREKEELRKHALDEVAEGLVGVLDNLQRALHPENDAKNYDILKDGVSLVEKQLSECLDKNGISPIDSVGKEFNPEFQEAIMTMPSEEFEEGIVLQEIQKGYMIHKRLLREAKVIVSAGMSSES